MKQKCVGCSKHFSPKSPHHLFHSKRCCDMYNRGKTWTSFLRRLIQSNTEERKALSVDFLLTLLRYQDGVCALSGIELTKITGKGPVETNASIDRINPKGGYIPSNVRLVCNFANSFRGTTGDDRFLWWCRKIVKHHEQ